MPRGRRPAASPLPADGSSRSPERKDPGALPSRASRDVAPGRSCAGDGGATCVHRTRTSVTDLHHGASVSRSLSRLVVAVRAALRERSSAFERETAVTPAIQLDQAPDRLKRLAVLLAVERGEHARVIAERGDRRADAASERLARRRRDAGRRSRACRPAPERPSARPRRSRARGRRRRRDRARATSALPSERRASRSSSASTEPAQVLLPHGRGRCRSRP